MDMGPKWLSPHGPGLGILPQSHLAAPIAYSTYMHQGIAIVIALNVLYSLLHLGIASIGKMIWCRGGWFEEGKQGH